MYLTTSWHIRVHLFLSPILEDNNHTWQSLFVLYRLGPPHACGFLPFPSVMRYAINWKTNKTPGVAVEECKMRLNVNTISPKILRLSITPITRLKIKQVASKDIYVKLHDVNWAFPNDYNYLFTIIINLPSPDGSNTSSIFVALTPSASWPDQKFSDVVGQRFRGTFTPEIKKA